MKISVVGSGRMGTGLMKVLAPVHANVLWGSRIPDSLRQRIQTEGFSAIPVSHCEAFTADVIFHSLWFKDVIPWAKEHAQLLNGKILVDIANPFTADFNDFTTEWGTSAAEELQKVIPGTSVVGAFKNTFWEVFNNPRHNGVLSDVYVTSDDETSRKLVLSILEALPFNVLDAGLLANNRTIERMTLFERELSIRYGHYPRVAFNIWGRS